MAKLKLDKEEKQILRAYERGLFKPVKNREEEMKLARLAARNTLTKDQRVNIRMTSHDLLSLKQKAFEEGIPYQTLIASIVHKFLTGRLKAI